VRKKNAQKKRAVSAPPEKSIKGNGFLIASCAAACVFLIAPLFIVRFLCLFFIFIIAGSRMYAEYLARSVKVFRRDKELREFKRQWVDVEIIVENQGRLPVFMVVISDSPGMLPLFQSNRFVCALPPRSRMVQRWKGFCADRGVFSLGPAIARGADPFGLFPFRLVFAAATKLFVYPEPCSAGLKPLGGVPLGVLLSQNPLNEDLSRARSLRPYQSGDEPRRINWKISAKSSGNAGFSLIINEYEATVSHPIMVFLNLDSNFYPPAKARSLIERAIEGAAAICLEYSRKKQDVGIIIFSRRNVDMITQDRFALIPILERLALAEYEARVDIPLSKEEKNKIAGVIIEKAKYLPSGTRIMYVGPNLEDEAYIVLSALKKFRLGVEYFIIDEKSVAGIAPGGDIRRQVKEMGYALI
jgi:uncharacterized protein (DUF58 family)